MRRTAKGLAAILGVCSTLICTLPLLADQIRKPVQLTNGPVQLTKGPVGLGSPVQLGGSSSLGGPVQLTKGPAQLTNGPVQLTNGPVQLTFGPVQLLGNGISLRNEGKCNHHLMVGTDTLFAFDKSDLTPAAQVTLTKLGGLIKKYGTHPATVEGHTDGKGTDQYNQGLSERRAQSVKTWLVAHSYIAEQTPAIGYGKKKPVAPNTHPDGSDNPAGRQLNRRVEVEIDTCH